MEPDRLCARAPQVGASPISFGRKMTILSVSRAQKGVGVMSATESLNV